MLASTSCWPGGEQRALRRLRGRAAAAQPHCQTSQQIDDRPRQEDELAGGEDRCQEWECGPGTIEGQQQANVLERVERRRESTEGDGNPTDRGKPPPIVFPGEIAYRGKGEGEEGSVGDQEAEVDPQR